MSHYAEIDNNNVVTRVIVAEQPFIDHRHGSSLFIINHLHGLSSLIPRTLCGNSDPVLFPWLRI